jgi:Domain of unknown function (DUF4913)
VDHHPLNGEHPEPSLAGLEPIIQRTAREVLEQHVASLVRKAIGGRLTSPAIEELARQAAERQLAELADPPGLYFETVAEWVEQWLLPVYRRSVRGHERAWCPQWWRHPEAVARLESLWRAWEHLRQDPALGLSIWFRDHAEHHMTILLDADGPFKGCDGRHSDRPLEPLPSDPPPAGMFEPEDPAAGAPAVGTSATHRRPPPRTGGRDVSLHRSR